jgi:hypothetical protein
MGSFRLGQGKRLQCWRKAALLHDLAIHVGDFAYSLNVAVAASDYAGSCAQVRESTQVLMLSKKQCGSNHAERVRCGLVACWSLSVWSLLLLSGQGSALRTENTAGGRFIACPFYKWPQQTKLEHESNRCSRSSTHRLSSALPALVLDSQGTGVLIAHTSRLLPPLPPLLLLLYTAATAADKALSDADTMALHLPSTILKLLRA